MSPELSDQTEETPGNRIKEAPKSPGCEEQID